MFAFRDYPVLSDGEIDLRLEKKIPADPERGRVPSYEFKITLHGEHQKVGGISLRLGDTDHLRKYAGHIGYGVDEPYRGHRYAAKACALIKQVALDHGMDTVWITCNPDNLASRRTCELIGGELVEIVDLPEDTEEYWEGDRQKCRYRWRIG